MHDFVPRGIFVGLKIENSANVGDVLVARIEVVYELCHWD